MSIEGIYQPGPARKGRSDMEKLDDICLEVCQLRPFDGFDQKSLKPDSLDRLVNTLNESERRDLLARSSDAGLSVEKLAGLIRGQDGKYLGVLRKLSEMEKQRRDSQDL